MPSGCKSITSHSAHRFYLFGLMATFSMASKHKFKVAPRSTAQRSQTFIVHECTCVDAQELLFCNTRTMENQAYRGRAQASTVWLSQWLSCSIFRPSVAEVAYGGIANKPNPAEQSLTEASPSQTAILQVKGHIAGVALLLLDPEPSLAAWARRFFTTLAQRTAGLVAAHGWSSLLQDMRLGRAGLGPLRGRSGHPRS
jgi:hypothetical protein